MFTGIIETIGEIRDVKRQDSNIIFTVASDLKSELKIDQSVSHNGVCLTVTGFTEDGHLVTAIDETLQRTSLKHWKLGSKVNLERCLAANGRFDGHIVQGHVDQIGKVDKIINENGSWKYFVSYDSSRGNITVEKGSICMNGVSLTVVDSEDEMFSVAIIPFTYEHTNFQFLKVGDEVNLEFDILGKYMQKILSK